MVKIWQIVKDNIFLLAFSSSIFLLRSNIPYAIYFFAELQIWLLINTARKDGFIKLFNILKQSVHSFYTYYIIIFFFLFGFAFNPLITETYKDFVNLLIIFSFIILFIFNINSLSFFEKFKDYFLGSFIFLFSTYLLVSFLISFFNNDLSNFFFAIKNSNSFDRNLYSLNLWISIIGIIILVIKAKKRIWLFLGNIYLSVLLILVLFSSSRRGIIIFGLFFFIFFINQIYGFIKKTNFYKKFTTLFSLYLAIFLLFLISIFIPGKLRSRIFDTAFNNQELKKEISITTYRYYRLLNPVASINKYQLLLWGPIFKSNNLDYKQLLITAEKEYKKNNYTQSINLIQEAEKKTDTIIKLINLLPSELQEVLPVRNKEVIQYLPELVKLPYTYTEFFSYKDIYNLFIENYRADAADFPFTFSFKNDNAQFNLTLPALANSEYELNFRIKSKKNPVNKLLVLNSTESKIKISENNYQKQDTILYNYKISILVNNKVSLNLSLLLNKNNIDSFALSDISWKLLSTANTETSENIYKKAKKELKKFKFEQNRNQSLWIYYFNAEKLTNITAQKKYSQSIIYAILNNNCLKPKLKNYSGTKIIEIANRKKIIFSTSKPFPRAKYDLPVIQNAIYQIDLEYYSNNNKKQIFYNIKPAPEASLVHLKFNILSDTTYKIGKYNKKTIKFKIDSINSAKIIYAFGLRKNMNIDTISIKNFKFQILEIEKDSILLSEAQYNFLKDWVIIEKRNDTITKLQKETEQYENKDFWQIDSSIYKSAGSGRLELWTFGWQYFKSLPWPKKIFGDGFNYYKIYKLKFGAKYGYNKSYFPHNPVIAALLYSGIIGAFVYLGFLFQVFYFYIKYRKDFGIFVLLFLLIFIYSFISGRTHFTIPYFVLFSIFPFLINFIKKQEFKKLD